MRFLVLTLLLMSTMSQVIVPGEDESLSEEEEHGDVDDEAVPETQIDDPFQTEAADPSEDHVSEASFLGSSREAEPEELNTQQVRRRSSRLLKKGSAFKAPLPSIKAWPVAKILEELFKSGIQPPLGCSHQQLFQFFIQ